MSTQSVVEPVTLLDEAIWADRLLIGEWVRGSAGSRVASSPSDGRQLGRIGWGSATDVDRAVEIAIPSQERWAAATFIDRANVLRRAGDLLAKHAGEISAWSAAEAGSAPAKADFEISVAVQECYEAAALASAPYGEVLRTSAARMSFSKRVPVGLVGVISPFNVPLGLSIRAVAPALALGNAVILKPDPRTAISAGVVLGRIFAEAGLPPGVLSVVNGAAEVGERLVAHPDIPVIAFTGSTEVGRAVGIAAAGALKRAHLELGGNSPLVVLDDVADIEQAAALGAFGSFFHAGQICMATSRHLVHSSVVEQYATRLAARAERLVVGDPSAGVVDIGPIIDERQRDRVHDIVTRTIAGGARLLTGGTYEGNFYKPTVLVDVPGESPAAQEEIFGPVAPVIAFDSVDEAVSLANASPFGLSLGILTGNVERGIAIAERIPTGLVHINAQTVNDEAVAPFGGMGDSGTGSRHGGTQANLDAFTEVRWLTIRADLAPSPF